LLGVISYEFLGSRCRTTVENGERTRTRILQQPFDFLDVQRCNRCPEALVEAPWMSETGGRTYKMFETTSSMAHGYKHDGSKHFKTIAFFPGLEL
jgi:hypothetical protein